MGPALLLIGIVMRFREQILERFPGLADRLPPGDPYGRSARRLIRQRRQGGVLFIFFGLLLLVGRLTA